MSTTRRVDNAIVVTFNDEFDKVDIMMNEDLHDIFMMYPDNMFVFTKENKDYTYTITVQIEKKCNDDNTPL